MPNGTKRRVKVNLTSELQTERYCFGCVAYRNMDTMCLYFRRRPKTEKDENFVECPIRLDECVKLLTVVEERKEVVQEDNPSLIPEESNKKPGRPKKNAEDDNA